MNRRTLIQRISLAVLALASMRIPGLPKTGLEVAAARRQLSDEASLLIEIEDLLALGTEESDLVYLVDVSPLRTYRSNHIPGAIHGFWRDTVDPNYPHFGAVITQGYEQQQRLDYVRELGVNLDDHVVVYDDQSGYRAARIVWFLRFLGFERASLLNGGLLAWQEAGESAESGVNDPPDVEDPQVLPQDGYYLVTRQLIDRVESGTSRIVDIRTDGERQEDHEGALRIGTIPGSVRLPWDTLVDSQANRLTPVTSIEAALAGAGITFDSEIVVYGLYGVDAALPWLVLKHAGYPNVVTYDRGWVEWASRPDLPIEPL